MRPQSLFAYANISAKSKPYAKMLKHMDQGFNMGNKNGVKNLVTLSL